MLRLAGFDSGNDWDDALTHLLTSLGKHRAKGGEWRRFPFYFTLLALLEIDHPLAHGEIKFALPQCARKLSHLKGDGEFGNRRSMLLTRVLEKFG